MGKWKMVRLGDVFFQIKNGASIKQGVLDGGIPITRIETISDGTFDREKLGYAGILDDKYSNFYLEDGDILMSHINSEKHLGKVALYKRKGKEQIIHGMNLLCLKSNSVSQEYAYYFFKSDSFKNQLPPITKKSVNQASFTVTALKELKIPLPPLDEQKRIAKNLDLASDIIKGYKEQLAELNKLVQSVFYEMFGDPVTNEKGWEITCLGEVCKKITDGTHNSPENSVTGEYRYITAKNIKRDGILLSNITYVTKQVHEEIYARCNPEIGDVLYIKDGVTTGIAVINTLNEPFSMLSSVALLKLKDTICNKYLCNVLNYEEMYQRIRENMGGAAITRLTLVKIKNIQIPLPPFLLQTRFASIVTEIEAQKAQIQHALTEAENLFNSLMQEYFE